jgi:uncharacterized pyridoxamine 5'-phosphate oxidase family protein
MEEVFDFLKNRTQVNFVATVSGDKPSLRPFGDPVLFNGKIYMLTHKSKQVYQQMQANPNICIVAYDEPSDTWVRIHAKAVDDSDNTEAKQAIITEFDWAEEAGYTLDNPDFAALYLADATAEIRDSDGEIKWQGSF